MDYTKTTLGELLSSSNETIRRNAISILKRVQGCDHKFEERRCVYCFKGEPQGINDCEHKNTTETAHGKYCLDCHSYVASENEVTREHKKNHMKNDVQVIHDQECLLCRLANGEKE